MMFFRVFPTAPTMFFPKTATKFNVSLHLHNISYIFHITYMIYNNFVYIPYTICIFYISPISFTSSASSTSTNTTPSTASTSTSSTSHTLHHQHQHPPPQPPNERNVNYTTTRNKDSTSIAIILRYNTL